MSTILGINAYHGDSSACVVIDGKLVAAVPLNVRGIAKHQRRGDAQQCWGKNAVGQKVGEGVKHGYGCWLS